MNDIKQFFTVVIDEIKKELGYLKRSKYSKPKDNAISNLRTRININNYRGLYCLLCIVSVVLSIILYPFNIILLWIILFCVAVYYFFANLPIKWPFTLPEDYPPIVIAMAVGYVIDTLVSIYYDCLFQFLIPYIISVLIIRLHSMICVTEVETEYYEKMKQETNENNNENTDEKKE